MTVNSENDRTQFETIAVCFRLDDFDSQFGVPLSDIYRERGCRPTGEPGRYVAVTPDGDDDPAASIDHAELRDRFIWHESDRERSFWASVDSINREALTAKERHFLALFWLAAHERVQAGALNADEYEARMEIASEVLYREAVRRGLDPRPIIEQRPGSGDTEAEKIVERLESLFGIECDREELQQPPVDAETHGREQLRALDEREIEILRALAQTPRKFVHIGRLAVSPGAPSSGTITNRLPGLLQRGLIVQKGKRGGVCITESGLRSLSAD